MKNLKIFDIFVFLIVFIFILSINAHESLAITSYNETGNTNGYFQAGNTRFNQNFINNFGLPATFTALLSDGKFHPFVSDMDNDGENEIIAFDGNTIKLYNGKEIILVNSYTFDASTSSYSNPILYDIDNDGKTEFIFARNTQEDILILEYNGTSLFNQTSISWDNAYHSDGESMIKCQAVNNCILIAVSNLTATTSANPSPVAIIGVSFNSTDQKQNINITSSIQSGIINTFTYCTPRIKDIQIDRQSANNPFYVFSMIKDASGNSGIDRATLFRVKVNPDGLFSGFTQDYVNESLGFTASSDNPAKCDTDGSSKYVTAPLVMDAVTGGNSETIFGLSRSSSTFEMLAFDISGTQINDHPFIATASGNMLSNPMKINAFPSSSKSALTDKATDYCILGSANSESSYSGCQDGCIDLLCGSSQFSFNSADTIEFFYFPTLFNITNEYEKYNVMTSSLKATDISTNGINTDEIINPFGIFKFNFQNSIVTDCGTSGLINDLCLDSIFAINEDASIISVDAEKSGLEDIIALTNSNLFYVNDLYSNSAPEICKEDTDCQINPCDTTWKLNTTGQVTIRADDIDLDMVSYKLIAYFGESNEIDSGFSANVSSGQSVTINFVANKTTPISTMRLIARDSFEPPHEVSTDATFSVALNGVSTNDCRRFLSGTGTPETGNETLGVITTISPNNGLTTGVGQIATNFGISSLLVWLFIMFSVAIGLFFVGMHEFHLSGSATLVMLGLAETLLLIIGTILGFVSVGIIIVLVVVSIVLIGFYMRRQVTGA